MANRPTLTDVTGAASLNPTTYNANNAELESSYDNLLGLGGVDEDNNSLTNDLDFNGNTGRNLKTPSEDGDLVTKVYADEFYGEGALASGYADDAEASAAAAASSEADALISETNAATSETNAAISEAASAANATYENIDANGDVGTGADQVSKGTHTHTGVYQALDSELTALSVAGSSADKLPYYTGGGTAALADFDSDARALLELGILTGEIKMWPTASAPTGYILCNGASYNTTTYASLFAVIGYTFGGSAANFNVPNFRDRSPMGVDTTVALAGTAGFKTHTLTTAELPPHTHSSDYPIWDTPGDSTGTSGQFTNASSKSKATGEKGDGDSHNNLHPVLGINFIIKT